MDEDDLWWVSHIKGKRSSWKPRVRSASLEKGKSLYGIEDILALYGWDGSVVARGVNAEYIRCPFHDDKKASGAIYIERARYRCYACGVSGDIYDLVQSQEGVDSPVDALRFIQEALGEAGACKK